MGLSVAVVAAIIGVSVFICAEIFLGGMIPSVTNTNESYQEMKDRAIEQIQTKIEIVNVSWAANGPWYDLNFTVKNNGSTVMDTNYFNILIDGVTQDFSSSTDIVYPEDNIYFSIIKLSGSGVKTLKIITDNGISDYTTYTIT